MRLVQLSDIHFGGECAPALEAATAYASACDPDLVFVTGDLTLNGLPREFRAAEAWLSRLPRPLLVTPGNHATPYWNLLLRWLEPFARYRRFIGQPSSSRFDRENLSARMINTARGAQPRLDWSKGAVSLGLARAAVAALPPGEVLKVVGCHHPLMEVADAPVTGDVHRGQTAARIFCEGGIDIVLSGHVHNPFAVALPYCDGKTYAVGAGTLSKRLRGTPAGFNVIDVDPAKAIVTALGWNGSAFETWREWVLPRRTCPAGEAVQAKLSRVEVVEKPEEPGL